MIFYSDKNVHEAAIERINFLFDEFPEHKMAVSFSGGKDSTAVLHLVKEVLDMRGIPRIPVFFLDQELEAPQTIEYIRYVMNLPWVEPIWVQSYFKEWNSSAGHWFNVWGPGEEWAREKEPNNPYKEIVPDTIQEFPKVMDAFCRAIFGRAFITLGGVRIEESPNRRNGLTHGSYHGMSYCKTNGKYDEKGNEGIVVYPIFDWSYKDVWLYIFDNKFKYNDLYNYYMTYKDLRTCRVSSFIHENSIQALEEIRAVAPRFYEAVYRRCANVNTSAQSLRKILNYEITLPVYFKDWDEYVCYLIEHLVAEKKRGEQIKKGYLSTKKSWLGKFGNYTEGRKYACDLIGRLVVESIVCEDYGLTKLRNGLLGLVKYWYEHYRDIKEANRGLSN